MPRYWFRSSVCRTRNQQNLYHTCNKQNSSYFPFRQYTWNTVESDVKDHKTNPTFFQICTVLTNTRFLSLDFVLEQSTQQSALDINKQPFMLIK